MYEFPCPYKQIAQIHFLSHNPLFPYDIQLYNFDILSQTCNSNFGRAQSYSDYNFIFHIFSMIVVNED